MPTYDYRCESCNHTFEYFQNMSDEPLIKCPDCNGKIRRLVSGGSGLIFKGSGFYLTDYVKNDSKEKQPIKTDEKKSKKVKEKKVKQKKKK